MAQDARRPGRVARSRLYRHRWAALAFAVLAILGAMTLLPETRGASIAFDLTSRSSPTWLATVCLPHDARVTMSWNASAASPAYTMVVEAPSGQTIHWPGALQQTDFFSVGGTYFVTAENLSRAAVSVHVELDWSESGSVYELYLAPQTTCAAA